MNPIQPRPKQPEVPLDALQAQLRQLARTIPPTTMDPFPTGIDPTPTLETLHNDLADQLGKLGVTIDELEKRLANVLWSHPEPDPVPEPSESYPCVALDFVADRIHQTKGYANRLRRLTERLAL